MTSLGRNLTLVVIGFAVLNTVVDIWAGQPWLLAGMLGFLLLCQIGVTFAESYESAEQECRYVTTVLDAPGKMPGSTLFYDAIRGRPIAWIEPRPPSGNGTSAVASVDDGSSPDSSATSAAGHDVGNG